jgi:uncharacterized protein involved in exopolysaccharide biosynthesis
MQTEPYLVLDDNGQQRSPAARLEAMRAELVRLGARYSGDHPDVVRLRREVAALEASTDRGAGRPDNPAYVSLQAGLASARAELKALLDQQAGIAGALAELRGRALKAPQVERDYQLLQRQLQDATGVREELTRMDASVNLGQSLETELKAEQLSLIEPPSLPERPVKPNRRLLLLAGLALALAAGAASVILVELFDDAVWSPKDIDAIIGALPLAVVPHIPTPAERRLRRLRPVLLAGAIGAVIVLVHVRYTPLDVLAYGLQRRVLAVVAPDAAGK